MIREWLPVTKRNRMALAFAAAALVMFISWNFLPYHEYGGSTSKGRVFQVVWAAYFDLKFYRYVMTSFDMDALRIVFIKLALLLNGLLVFAILPFWKIIHASRYLTVTLAVAHAAGGLYFLWGLFTQGYAHESVPYLSLTLLLVGMTMLILAAALLIFKNELELRYELELEKTLNSKL